MTSLIFGQPRDIMDGRSDYFWWTVHRRGSLLQSAGSVWVTGWMMRSVYVALLTHEGVFVYRRIALCSLDAQSRRAVCDALHHHD